MNRRQFLAGSAGQAALLTTSRTSALDVDIIENPILRVFDMLPASPEPDGFEFPITTGTLGELQRSVWPENPDKYWDPEGEDYHSVLGFFPGWMKQRGSQAGASLWQLSASYSLETSQATLESNGWEMVDDDLRILRYSGDEKDRSALAGSMNALGSWVRDGEWDWVALPDEASLVVGNNEDRLRTIADRVKNYTAMSTIDGQFHQLRYILRPDAYFTSLLPPQRLPVEASYAAFISRSWTGGVPIIHSIGLRLEGRDQIQLLITTVQERLETQTSSLVGNAYAEFLEITDIVDHGGTVRFDLIDSSGEWDIFHAFNADDLGMLPLESDNH